MFTSANTTQESFIERLGRLKWKLLEAEPFLGYLATELPTIVITNEEDPIKTAATDYKKFYYNEKWCNALKDSELIFVIAHEISHVVFAHKSRRGCRNPQLWNVAADFAINGILMKSIGDKSSRAIASMPKQTVPGKRKKEVQVGCYDAKYDGLTAEEIYEQLKQELKSKGANIDALFNEDGTLKDEVSDEIAKKLQTMDGETAKNEEASGSGNLEQMQAISKALIRSQEYRHRKEQGSQPGAWERMADEGFKPHPVWHAELRAVLQSKGRENCDWRRPNKKFLGIRINNNPLYMPSFTGVTYGTIVVAVDTSGSIDNDMLGQFISELNYLLSCGKDLVLHLYCCDAEVIKIGTYRPGNKINPAELKGGGGTSFKPAFREAEEINQRTKVTHMVYFTDTYGEFPDKEPPFPTLWLVPEVCEKNVPFGKVITLPIEKR